MRVEDHITWFGGTEKSPHKYFRFCYSDKLDPDLKLHQKYFTVLTYGTKKKTLAAVKAYKKEFLEGLACSRDEDPFYKTARLKLINANGHINPILIRYMNVHINKDYIRKRFSQNSHDWRDLWNGYNGKRCKFIKAPPQITVHKVNKKRRKIICANFAFTDWQSYTQAYIDACSLLIDESVYDEHHFLTMLDKKPTWSMILQYVLAYKEYQKDE